MRANARSPLALALATAALGAACARRPAVAPAEERWDTMSMDRKLAYMREVVTPRMKAIFVAYDPHSYARMDCRTCHGADGEARGWTMPNADLLLEPSPWNTTNASAGDAPSQFDAFMARSVAPEMAKLLGRSFVPSAKPKQGCFVCHAVDG